MFTFVLNTPAAVYGIADSNYSSSNGFTTTRRAYLLVDVVILFYENLLYLIITIC